MFREAMSSGSGGGEKIASETYIGGSVTIAKTTYNLLDDIANYEYLAFTIRAQNLNEEFPTEANNTNNRVLAFIKVDDFIKIGSVTGAVMIGSPAVNTTITLTYINNMQISCSYGNAYRSLGIFGIK